MATTDQLRTVPRRGGRRPDGPAAPTPPATERIGVKLDANAAPPRRTHWKALDGLRGIAVAAVLVYHAELGWLNGGFLGVDLFFTLSGYLITSILLSERERTGSIDYRNFIWRRFRRLLPALIAVAAFIGIVSLFGWFGEAGGVRDDALGTIFYARNWQLIVGNVDYFNQLVPSPFTHAWSLAIEEQFYLVWPLVLVAIVWAVGGRRKPLAIAIGVLAGASALWCAYLYLSTGDINRVYFGTDTRAQSLLFGAVLAVVFQRQSRQKLRAARQKMEVAGFAAVAVLVLLWLVVGKSSAFPYLGGFAISSALAGVVIAGTRLPGGSTLGLFLTLPPLRFLGLISYGLYLWHYPIYLVVTQDRTGLSGYELFGARLAITFAIAIASYYLIEKPLLSPTSEGRASFARYTMTFAVLAILVSLVAATLMPAKATADDVSIAAKSVERGLVTLPSTTTTPGVPSTEAAPAPPPPSKVMVVGDSVALTLTLGVAKVAPYQNMQVWSASIMGCGLTNESNRTWGGAANQPPPECKTRDQQWSDALSQFEPDATLVLSGHWEVQDHDGMSFGTPQFDAYARDSIQRSIDVLTAAGGRVIFLTTPYFDRVTPAVGPQGPWSESDKERINWWNGLLREAAAAQPEKVAVIDLNAQLAPTGDYDEMYQGLDWNKDGVHFNEDAATKVSEWLVPEVVKTVHPGAVPAS